MKTIELTQNQATLVNNLDYEYLSQWKWYASWDGKHWRPKRALPIVNGKQKHILMHTVIAERMGIDANYIDHKDRNTLNNQRKNLRSATCSQNLHNRGTNSNSTTGVKGVCFHKARGKYQAQIVFEGKYYYLGYFDTITEAEKVVQQKRKELVGEFACN